MALPKNEDNICNETNPQPNDVRLSCKVQMVSPKHLPAPRCKRTLRDSNKENKDNKPLQNALDVVCIDNNKN